MHHTHKLWKETHYVSIYIMARKGMKLNAIANTLGIAKPTLLQWRDRDPAVRDAIARGRDNKAGNTVETLNEAVYNQLPPHLKQAWDNLQACDKKSVSGIEQWERILETHGQSMRMHLFFYALVANSFNPSKAAAAVGVTMTCVKGWATKYPEFAELLSEFHTHKQNYIEEHLFRLIGSGDSAATIFASKTLNRNRGYNDKVQIEVNHGPQTNGNMVDISTLPLDLRKAILNHLRNPNGPPALEYKRLGSKWVPEGEENSTDHLKTAEDVDIDHLREDVA